MKRRLPEWQELPPPLYIPRTTILPTLPGYTLSRYLWDECGLTKGLQRSGRSATIWENGAVYPTRDTNKGPARFTSHAVPSIHPANA